MVFVSIVHSLPTSHATLAVDYDRTRFASEAVQRKHFRALRFLYLSPYSDLIKPLASLGSQLGLAKEYHLPLFLHSRAAHADFVKILREEGFGTDGGRAVGARGGVVHSFTGTAEEAKELVSVRLGPTVRPTMTSHRWTWDFTSGWCRESWFLIT